VVSFPPRCERDARRGCRRKAPWIGNAHAFHEAPAEPILAASRPPGGIRASKGRPHAHEPGGGDRGVRGERNRPAPEGRRPPRVRATGRRSGKRAVKRGSPRSRLQRAAPSLPLPAPARLRTGESSTRKRRSRGRARSREAPGRERRSRGAERLRASKLANAKAFLGSSLRRETTEHECSSRNGFGVQKSIGRTAGRDPRNARKRKTDRRDLARRSHGGSTKRLRRARTKTVRGPVSTPSNQETLTGPSRTRKPRRDRIRRGAGSGTREVQGPRACDGRYDGRVSESRMRPPKPGTRTAALASRVNAARASARAAS